VWTAGARGNTNTKFSEEKSAKCPAARTLNFTSSISSPSYSQVGSFIIRSNSKTDFVFQDHGSVTRSNIFVRVKSRPGSNIFIGVKQDINLLEAEKRRAIRLISGPTGTYD
jgi:hypothetical protein